MKTLQNIFIGISAMLLFAVFNLSFKSVRIYPQIDEYIKVAQKDFDKIPQERKDQLKKISLFLKSKIAAEKSASLLFICTHNSRRSHMAQIWAQTAAYFYSVKGVSCYSGGTEASAFNARAVKALTKSGFKISKPAEDKNPVYEVKFSDDAPEIKAFSKKYSDEPNPKSNFCAVMTCSQADKTCPSIEGCSLRVALPYEDPKVSDGTPEEEAKYDERCKQIATEMLYLFSLYSK